VQADDEWRKLPMQASSWASTAAAQLSGNGSRTSGLQTCQRSKLPTSSSALRRCCSGWLHLHVGNILKAPCCAHVIIVGCLLMQLADVKKGITDEDILALATDEANQPAVVWDLADLQVSQRACLLCCAQSGV
jgi:hypothetical protein